MPKTIRPFGIYIYCTSSPFPLSLFFVYSGFDVFNHIANRRKHFSISSGISVILPPAGLHWISV